MSPHTSCEMLQDHKTFQFIPARADLGGCGEFFPARRRGAIWPLPHGFRQSILRELSTHGSPRGACSGESREESGEWRVTSDEQHWILRLCQPGKKTIRSAKKLHCPVPLAVVESPHRSPASRLVRRRLEQSCPRKFLRSPSG